MLQQDQEFIALIVAGTIILLLLGIFIIGFLFFYQKKHNTHLTEKETLRAAFNQELLKTRIEIQEETFLNVSREIHDNITQVLGFVKLNLGMISDVDEQSKEKISESRELVAQSINDLRNLSKSLSFEHIVQLGLVKTIEGEAVRITKSGLLEVAVFVTGEIYPLDEQCELVLFRIFQESLNNTLKHAGATHLKISLQYSAELFTLTLEDDGAGFSTELLDNKSGAGLKNMANRATLIGATATIDSSPGKGCSIVVTLNPFKQQLYIDGTDPDRFS